MPLPRRRRDSRTFAELKKDVGISPKAKKPVEEPAPDEGPDWLPSTTACGLILLGFRFCSAALNNVTDCDECFMSSYMAAASKHGNTRLSTLFGLFFYIFIHFAKAAPLSWIFSDKRFIFYGMRQIFSIFTATGEFCLYRSICARFSRTTGTFFLLFSAIASGMFISSTAFLPSTFAMVLNMFAMSAYLDENLFFAVLSTCISTFVGWPFAAVLGAPIVIDMLFLRKNKQRIAFFVYAIFAALLVGVPMYYYDSHHYGKSIFAPLNIVLYNVISGHGPELYGVEPMSYYVKNLFLNWNFIVPMAFCGLPLVWLNRAQERALVKYYLILGTFFAWIAIFFLTPHKEERFLFPIYPMIAYLGATFASAATSLVSKLSSGKILSKAQFYAIMILFATLSVSRTLAIFRNYSGSIQIYHSMNDYFIAARGKFDYCGNDVPIRVCVGKEWYRFPSSFFLPEAASDGNGCTRKVELGYLKSSFRGILPRPWTPGKTLRDMTTAIPDGMNDENREETDRYVPLSTCHYLIDLDREDATEEEPNFRKSKQFVALHSNKFLHPNSPPSIYRSFYVPQLSEHHCKTASYTLYKSRQLQ
ncbi:unnamed protein product, partial [Mesorhabditis spiculigera]